MVLATLDNLRAELCIEIAQNELKTGQFQQSGHIHPHAHLHKTTSGASANAAAC